MKLENAVVFVTGANRGIGLEFACQALERGARKVYAAVRDPAAVTLPGIVPVHLDITDPALVAQAAHDCADTTLVVNNAGIATLGSLLEARRNDELRRMLDTNVIGTLSVSQAFAPVLARHGGGAFLNVFSVASWISTPDLAAYAVSKAAAWNLGNGLRIALKGQGTQVLALHVGFVDTDLTRAIALHKLAPGAVAAAGYAALEDGASEVLVDELAREVKRGLSAEPGIYLDTVARTG